jgi:hypothetical protein
VRLNERVGWVGGVSEEHLGIQFSEDLRVSRGSQNELKVIGECE